MGWGAAHQVPPHVTILRLEERVAQLTADLEAERVAKAFAPRREGVTVWRQRQLIEIVEWDGNPATIDPFLSSTTLRLNDGSSLEWYDDDRWHPVPVGAFINVTSSPYYVHMDPDGFKRRWEPVG